MSSRRFQEEIVAGVSGAQPSAPFPSTLVLTPLERRPIKLPQETIHTVLEKPLPSAPAVLDTIAGRGGIKRVSIVIISFNNLVFTRLCLESVLANTDYPSYEVIVIDNNSTDGTPDYLTALAQNYLRIRVLLNKENRGFAPANNQGLELADGDVFILLNNDTIVPRGWLTRLVEHVGDDSIGLLGPVTNRIGNEAEIETSYHTYGELETFAQEYTQQHAGQSFDIGTLCMFCLAMRRDVYERLGSLDERFEIGMLEDDDYSMRAHRAHYRVVCAEDVFVHHFGGASFGNLIPTGEYGQLLERNQRRFEEKWGEPWKPYGRRLSQDYVQLADRIREVARCVIPPDALVLVVSKGDEELLVLNGQKAWHFPQGENGDYAGYYPANSGDAISQLEELRQRSASFVVFPNTAFWWLDHYQDFRGHLETHYQRIWGDDACIIYCLCAASNN